MKYAILFRNYTNVENGIEYLGVRIQPPISDIAAAGICKVLADKPKGYRTGNEHMAEDATITNQDPNFTALVIRPNHMLSVGTITTAISRMLDPISYKDTTITGYY